MKCRIHRIFNIALAAVSAVLMILAAAGCKKNKNYDLKPNLDVANDIVFAERGLIHTFNLLLKANMDSSIMKGNFGLIDSASVIYSSVTKTFTIIYRNKSCADSAVRNGTIIITLTANFFTTGCAATVVFQNYSEDSRKFIGKDFILNTGMALGGNGGYNSTIAGLSIVRDSTHYLMWNSQLTYKLPPVLLKQPDNIAPFTITGTGNGTSSGTYAFAFQISTPLLNDIYCPWIRQGVMQVSLSPVDVTSGTIEYTNSNKCNNRVRYDFEGNVYEWWIIGRKLNI